jgi:EAL and modified HD-GYP domain-containing signal transduction protein
MHRLKGFPAGTRINEEFFLGRQPIVGRNGELLAYEILFRSGNTNHAVITDDVAASAAVIQHVFLDFGMDAALGQNLGFINISETLLMSDVIEMLPRRRVVLELLESVRFTPEVIARCHALRAAGYRLALDDVTRLDPAQAQAFDLVEIIKIDIRGMELAHLRSLVEALRPYGKILLAEKVETTEQHQFCRELGFELFQGYFFAKAVTLRGRTIHTSELSLLKLIKMVAADADIAPLEDELKRAPELTMRLLRLVNSAAFALPKKISTLRNAIIVLGRTQLNHLLHIMLFAKTNNGVPGTNPLMQTAVIRGRLMEGAALAMDKPALIKNAFMTGMLSLVDILFDHDVHHIIQMLDLDIPTQAALLRREGTLGLLLQLTEAAEALDQQRVQELLRDLKLEGHCDFNKLQVEALKWANSL